MPNSDKAKGTRFETEVVTLLREAGLKAQKPRQTSFRDVGDIHLEDDMVLQAKAWDNLASALRVGTMGAEVQAINARRPFGFAVVKRPRAAVSEAYVVIPLRAFIRFLLSRRTP